MNTTPNTTPEELAEVQRLVGKAKTALLMNHRFFGRVVSLRPITYTETAPTAGMMATGQMLINPRWCTDTGLTVKNMMFLLAHECCHYMFRHFRRMGHRDARAWNVATDKWINDTLIHAGVGDFIEGGIKCDGARDSSSEQLYEEPPKQDDGGGEGGEGGEGGIGTGDILPGMNPDGTALTPAELSDLDVRVEVEVIQAAKAAQSRGQLPGSLQRLIEQMTTSKVKWHEELEPYMASFVKDDISWRTPERRFISDGLYLPADTDEPSAGTIVIAVDTSGSIGQAELSECNGHINQVLFTCNPEKVVVVYCDMQINKIVEFTPEDFPVQLENVGGGGTSFAPVFDWAENLGEGVDVIVYLTDGYGDQDSLPVSSTPTVWLSTANQNFPWGHVIPFEKG